MSAEMDAKTRRKGTNDADQCVCLRRIGGRRVRRHPMARILLINQGGALASRITASLEARHHEVRCMTAQHLSDTSFDAAVPGSDVAILRLNVASESDWGLLRRLCMLSASSHQGPAVLAIVPRDGGISARLRAERLGARCIFDD